MLAVLQKLLAPKPPEAARATYIALLAQARHPFFFGPLHVPDTLDGRFELVVLHLFLLQHRLRDAAPGFAQFLSEVFIQDMDASLRELGVGDTGVSHRVKAMGKAYHGRLQAYGMGISDPQALRAALARNLYGTEPEGDVALLGRAAVYLTHLTALLAATPTDTITQGRFAWPAPDGLGL